MPSWDPLYLGFRDKQLKHSDISFVFWCLFNHLFVDACGVRHQLLFMYIQHMAVADGCCRWLLLGLACVYICISLQLSVQACTACFGGFMLGFCRNVAFESLDGMLVTKKIWNEGIKKTKDDHTLSILLFP